MRVMATIMGRDRRQAKFAIADLVGRVRGGPVSAVVADCGGVAQNGRPMRVLAQFVLLALCSALLPSPCTSQCLPYLDPFPTGLNDRSWSVLAVGLDDVVADRRR